MMPSRDIDRLLAIMAALRTPGSGCPWDLEQSFATIAPYTVEEAYEVADAIQRGDMDDLKEELGDLLLQVVYHARMAEEEGVFDFAAVAEAISDKMVRRHPHVFGSDEVESAAHQTSRWEAIKAAERAAKGRKQGGVLAGIPTGLPALTRAVKLTGRAARAGFGWPSARAGGEQLGGRAVPGGVKRAGRAARAGFDWPSAREVMDKLREETAELEAEIEAGDLAKAREELGDLLFVVANLARKLEVEPEDALRAANAKVTRRFAHIEARVG